MEGQEKEGSQAEIWWNKRLYGEVKRKLNSLLTFMLMSLYT